MNEMVWPLITDFDTKLPVYLFSAGYNHIQEHVKRPTGYPSFQWIQSVYGKGELVIGDRIYTVNENQGMLLYPNVPHEYYSLTDFWEVHWIGIQGYAVDDFFKNSQMKLSGVYSISKGNQIASKIKRIIDIDASNISFKNIEYSKIVYDLLMNLLMYTSGSNDMDVNRQYAKLNPVLDYISDNYNLDITLDQLSEVMNITPEHFCIIFKKILGMRVFEYINSVRIKKGKELLIMQRDLSVKNIAGLCGFQDASYFCSVFRRFEKISPGEFRRLYGIQKAAQK